MTATRSVLVLVIALGAGVVPARAAEPALQDSPPDAGLPTYLKDRGTGLPTTLFGTYIRRGDWIVYPFFEYYRDQNREYKPSELGFAGELDFRGRYRASEGLLYVGYGLTNDLAVELEAAAHPSHALQVRRGPLRPAGQARGVGTGGH